MKRVGWLLLLAAFSVHAADSVYQVKGKEGSTYTVKGNTYITDENGNLKGWVQPTTRKSSTVFDSEGNVRGQAAESASTIPPIPSIPAIPAIPR